MDTTRLISARSRAVDASGIRRVFDLAAKMRSPINLSIGQPEFEVPEPIRRAAIEAIEQGRNGYTQTQGVPALRRRIAEHIRADLGWEVDPDLSPERHAQPGLIVTAGTAGAVILALLALVDPGDEVIFGDPYFVMYPHAVTIAGGRSVICDTYPDFVLSAERVEPLITPRTKALILNSPGNPTGVVLDSSRCAELRELCRSRGVLLISDEIYDEFTFSDAREPHAGFAGGRCPSPARAAGAAEDVLLVRGFGKTYGVTGWRLGFAAGPRPVIEELAKLQQYSYTCAPAPLQWGVASALDVDMSPQIRAYERRRDRIMEVLGPITEVQRPGGAFYAFVKVPERLGISASEFARRAVEHELLIIPGSVFSTRDTHFRLSFATADETLERGLDVLSRLLRG